MTKRSNAEMVYAVLEALQSTVALKPTHIMHKVNINGCQLKRILDTLISQGYIVTLTLTGKTYLNRSLHKKRCLYSLTAKGKELYHDAESSQKQLHSIDIATERQRYIAEAEEMKASNERGSWQLN